MKLKHSLYLCLAVVGVSSGAFADETLNLTGRFKDTSLRFYGFVETDFITDTTQAFTETQASGLVPTRTASGGGANNFPGQYHRTMLSSRLSRFGFDLTLPKTDSGLATEGILEMDFVGNNAPNTLPGATPGAQTDASFFNNAALRVRLAYINLTYQDKWNAKMGQYWSLLGWQPVYFTGEVSPQPVPIEVFARFTQIRSTNLFHLGSDWTLETAIDVAKPPEMNSGNPEFQGGARIASTKYKGFSTTEHSTSMVGLSAAVTGALLPIRTNGIGNPTGAVVVLDWLVPIIPSPDGKDRRNNLVWIGEASTGNGYGGVEVPSLTLGVAGVTTATPNAGSAVDAGIAGVNAQGNAELIRYRTMRSNLTYGFPSDKWSASIGYGQIEGRNLSRFSNTAAKANAIAPKIQFGYAALFYDPLAWLRFGAEFNQSRDTYNDPANRYAINNRYQVSTILVF